MSLGPSAVRNFSPFRATGKMTYLPKLSTPPLHLLHLFHGVLQVQEGQMLSKEQEQHEQCSLNMTDAKSSPIPGDTV